MKQKISLLEMVEKASLRPVNFRQESKPMTGHVTKLPKGFKLKDGKLTKVAYFPNASAAIKAKKSKRARVVRRTAG